MPSANEPGKGERERRIASRVAARFGPYECEACAAAIIKALHRESGARVLRIHPGDGSKHMGLVKTQSFISNNRFHVAVQVGDTVFDNLHPEGAPIAGWLPGFFTRTGAELVVAERPVAAFFGTRFRREQFRNWVNMG